MSRYHINPATGNPGLCRAKKQCPFGGEPDHYSSKDEARMAYEEIQANIPPKSQWVAGHYNGERDVVDGRPGRWSTQVIMGWGPTARPTFFADDAGQEDDPATLPNSFEDDESWRAVVRRAEVTGALPGLMEAQTAFLGYVNNESAKYYPSGAFNGPISEHADEMARRALNGEVSNYNPELYDRNFKQIPPREKLFYALTQETSIISRNVLDAALVFPERDLMPVLERLGVENVSISAFDNGRENGLVYTVMTPEGDTRSFNLYEHRNTDSLIINGETNWDPAASKYPWPKMEEGIKSSKNHFFAEFSHDTSKRQVAETLGYFLQQAQRGNLDSDHDLVTKAEHLDWNAILSKQLPGFEEWAKENGYEPKKDRFGDF